MHLPFCRTICPFCSFPILKNRAPLRKNYLILLLQEIRLWQDKFPNLSKNCLSFYVGGGTPSCYSAKDISTIKQALKIPDSALCSIEINPEDAHLDYLKSIVDLGFNRLSLGVQSFSDQHLKILGRNNTAKQNFLAMEALQKAGIDDFNLDILYGYPDQSLADLDKDLATYLSFNPPHLSAYGLTLEPKTPAFKNIYWQDWNKGKEGLFVEQFKLINISTHQAGLNRYEISNFAKPGFLSLQNLIYWQQKPFLGIGLGAFSRYKKQRFFNYANLAKWQQAINDNQLPVDITENMTNRKILDEYLLMALRRKSGISFAKLTNFLGQIDFYSIFSKELSNLREKMLIKINQRGITLTEKGLMLVDSIILKISTIIDSKLDEK